MEPMTRSNLYGQNEEYGVSTNEAQQGAKVVTARWDTVPRHFNHHTITTGHSRRSDLSEVGNELGLESHVEQMLRGRVPIPNFPGMFAQASVTGQHLLVDVSCGVRVLVRFVVAPISDQASQKAFEDILKYDMHRIGNREPRAPYCSASITFAGLLQSQELYWIADYERCIAWTWFAMVADKGSVI